MSMSTSLMLTVLAGVVLLSNWAHCQTGLTASDEAELLNAHNYFRGRVDPIATNMERMVWNDELAEVAQTYAEMCVFAHNGNRNAQQSSFKFVGENLAITTANPGNYTSLVESWYNEVQDYDYDTGMCNDGAVCGHYTQVVWATSNNLGCGVYRCTTTENFDHANALLLVCNYGPSGNFAGQKPYQSGSEVCSACPAQKPYCVDNLCSIMGTTTMPEPSASTVPPNPAIMATTTMPEPSGSTVPPTPGPGTGDDDGNGGRRALVPLSIGVLVALAFIQYFTF